MEKPLPLLAADEEESRIKLTGTHIVSRIHCAAHLFPSQVPSFSSACRFGSTMRENVKNRLIRCKFCERLLLGAASFVLVSLLTTLSANASGCSYGHGHSATDVPSGITRVYENGRFYYYNVVPPCSGAKCGRSDSSSLVSAPSMVSNDRTTSLVFDSPCRLGDIPRHSSSYVAAYSSYTSPALDEPLRPPV